MAIVINKALETLGVKTYNQWKKTREDPTISNRENMKILLNYMDEIERAVQHNAETYVLRRFIQGWVDTKNKRNPWVHGRTERFAIMIPEDMPWGALAYVLSIFLNNGESLSTIADVLRKEGYKVFHNRTGIDQHSPNTEVQVFLFEGNEDHLIWILKEKKRG